ncbi:transmembrane protein 248 [Gouania willdenowi]|uniref:Transmembrane protein 248-like n=1 Tax=Gouania willdenowi TaxID=441366 RepID=A0A8C5G4I6_GOUWI|nr:transmembrane protein 248-like [Gouania willdenowi]XP_028314166.1 transmembrane protein 248-like [Gouania willdenowi]
MGFWNPVANLREYIFNNPPGTTFFLCMLTLAITFISLSSYSRIHALPNPDTAKDWNHLLFALAQFKLCERVNVNTSELTSSSPSPLMELDKNNKAELNSTTTPFITYLRLEVPLVVSTSSSSDSLTDITLHTTLKASQLNMGGEDIVDVTLEFRSGNNTHTCLSLSAPANLMPVSVPPPQCHATNENDKSVHVEVSETLPTASNQCYSLKSEEDPTLRVDANKGVAVHHLVEFSVCLFVVCFLFCFAASLPCTMKRRHYWSGLDSQNEPLINES